MITKSVTVSGAVGKQVYATTEQVVLRGMRITPVSANVIVTVRDGGGAAASGTVRFVESQLSAHGSDGFMLPGLGMRFDKGLHVMVIGTGGTAYLIVD